jgi:hypothetical protein
MLRLDYETSVSIPMLVPKACFDLVLVFIYILIVYLFVFLDYYKK